jgi:hypothetical protein
VIPSVLVTADVPEIATLVFPRKLLYCQVRDGQHADSQQYRIRFQEILAQVNPQGREWVWYYPDKLLDAKLLIEWMRAP